MSGFSFPSVATDATAPEAPIQNDGWFPDVDPQQLRKERRIRDSVTPERLRNAIIGAIITVGNQLADWQAGKIAVAPLALDDVPSTKIDGISRLVLLYHRAIGAYAKAELVEAYRDVDTTTAGQRQAEELEPSIVELRRDALHAIRDILGRSRVRSELI